MHYRCDNLSPVTSVMHYGRDNISPVTSVMLSKSLRTHYGRITDVTPRAQISVPSRQFSSYVDEIRHGSPAPWFQ